ncbi:MAG: ABC transporter ATP-binding protein [Gracilimonas sp.]|uniref:ABC transporter ATP-binding protein n=1 Tax=Gracilimonas sp. TaxID=1974203 RepID=UPI001B1836A7|nr:ABC transporter ATP-binding protein [Gracilimonas sp.]MBO6585445.1 ABC transporter ATP-binding protein [Gracilimonas sp.]MBO6616441.1 ABC transporter ATP-binding protein [Gracilimonas sp.]
MSVITTENLTKVYNPDPDKVPVHALNGVDLTIEKGEFTAIVGPSGSGKTTLLNIIGGLDEPTEGKAFIKDTDLTTLSDSELIKFRLNHIGFVFQAYNLIPVLTAIENVSFVMQMQGRPSAECREKSLALLKEVGLEDKIHKRPSELSGGQQQRVAVARALASKPDFVLADEPTANLDSVSTAELLDMMLDLNKREDMTFVFSTHDQRVIDRARRVVTLVDGKIDSDEKRG